MGLNMKVSLEINPYPVIHISLNKQNIVLTSLNKLRSSNGAHNSVLTANGIKNIQQSKMSRGINRNVNTTPLKKRKKITRLKTGLLSSRKNQTRRIWTSDVQYEKSHSYGQ